MVACPVWVKSTEGKQMCGRPSEVLLRAFYKGLTHFYKYKSQKLDDAFGLCDEHGQIFVTDVSVWNPVNKNGILDIGSLSGQRGLVERVEIIRSSDHAAVINDDKSSLIMSSIKSELKRKMNNRSTNRLTADNWRQLFDECLNEWIVEQVINT